jgi:hypothetical protein
MILKLLFLPGNIVLKFLGVSIEEDGGVIRSFINSVFWGILCLAIAMKYFL